MIFTLESRGIFLAATITMFFEAYLGIYFMIECRIVAFLLRNWKSILSACALLARLRFASKDGYNSEAQFITRAFHRKPSKILFNQLRVRVSNSLTTQNRCCGRGCCYCWRFLPLNFSYVYLCIYLFLD